MGLRGKAVRIRDVRSVKADFVFQFPGVWKAVTVCPFNVFSLFCRDVMLFFRPFSGRMLGYGGAYGSVFFPLVC